MRPALLIALAGLTCGAGCARPPLRVCADPNNLPFSNARREGFENRIVEEVARRLGRPVAYTWWTQRKTYLRRTLGEDACDVWPGVATGVKGMAATAPYYRSSYVFVSRADRKLDISSLDDPRLRPLRIGVQMIAGDGMDTPPAQALANRGLSSNLRPFVIDQDYDRTNPTSSIVEAVDRGDVDVALVWGPLAGYFATKAAHPLTVVPVSASSAAAQWPMTFDISMGVRRGDRKLRESLEGALREERPFIARTLHRYNVPVAPTPTSLPSATGSAAGGGGPSG